MEFQSISKEFFAKLVSDKFSVVYYWFLWVVDSFSNIPSKRVIGFQYLRTEAARCRRHSWSSLDCYWTAAAQLLINRKWITHKCKSLKCTNLMQVLENIHWKFLLIQIEFFLSVLFFFLLSWRNNHRAQTLNHRLEKWISLCYHWLILKRTDSYNW